MKVPIGFKSAIMGDVPENVHYFIDGDDYDALINRYSKAAHIHRVIIPGIFKAEYEFGGRNVDGKEAYDFLIDYGFNEKNALSIIKLLFASEDVVERMTEDGYDKSIIYDYNHIERMRMIGLEYLRYTKLYVLSSDVYVHPIYTEYEWVEPPEPPEDILEYWRNFEVSMLMDCTTRTKQGETEHRKVEFRGIFVAEKSAIMDWELYYKGIGHTEAHDIVGDAVRVAESILKDYYEVKGYDFMHTCSGPTFNGFDPLEGMDGIDVWEDDAEVKVSDTVLEVIDIDYGNVKRFTDEFALVGRWWNNKSYVISELRKQVKGVY